MQTTVYLHGGDYDCSELVRMCYRAAGVLPYGSYCWTGNEIELLTSHGFVERSLSSPQQGDVLWRDGHTELYLGNGMQGGARISEHGTITGAKGDQTGNEVTRSVYRAGEWSKLLRYEGGHTCDGILAAYVATMVANHLIDHDAHGYSQPNRAGDGTIEKLTITYDPPSTFVACRFRATFNRDVRVRTSPKLARDNALDVHWHAGEGRIMDGLWLADGCCWATYIGPTTKRRLYAAIQQNGVEYAKVEVV